MKMPAVLERFLDRPAVMTGRRVLEIYGLAPGGLLANGLAFTTLFAVVPIALVTLGVAGLLVKDPEVQQQLATALSSLVPPLQDLIQSALVSMSQGAAVTSLVGLVGLLWTVSQFYVTLDVAFSRIFTDRRERDVFLRMARGFVWVVGLVGVVVVLIVAAALGAAAKAFLPGSEGTVAFIGDILGTPIVLFAIGIAVVAVVYRTVPPEPPAWEAILLPAAVAGAVIVGLSQLFLYLAPRLIGATALAGSLATAFVALAWLSF